MTSGMKNKHFINFLRQKRRSATAVKSQQRRLKRFHLIPSEIFSKLDLGHSDS